MSPELLPWVVLFVGLIVAMVGLVWMALEVVVIRHELRRLRTQRQPPCPDLQDHICGARGIVGTNANGTAKAGNRAGHMDWIG